MFNPHINEIVENFGSWLYYPMLFFTSFGYENIYLVFMAILYWYQRKLRFRVGVMLLMSSYGFKHIEYSYTHPGHTGWIPM